MMEEVRKYKIDEIPQGTFIKSINNKPLAVFIVPGLVGFAMLFGSWKLRIFGLMFIVFTAFVYMKFKKRNVVDIYEEFFLIYDADNLVTLIKWPEVKTWDLKVSSNAEDQLFIELHDGNFYEIAMFGIGKDSVHFRKFAFEANHREQVKARENARGSSMRFGRKKRD